MSADAAPAGQVLSIVSDLTFDGVYVPTIALDDRHLLTLDRERAMQYVAAWADAIARAEFDAAVFAQLTGLGIDERTAGLVVVQDLRPDRPPLDCSAIAPLRLAPIMSARTKRGQVDMYHGDEHLLQLDAPAVYDHIGKVLPVVMTCDLDASYRRFAIAQLDQSRSRAEAMVADLGVRWRLPETEGAEHDKRIQEQFGSIVASLTPGDAPVRPRLQAGQGHGRRGKQKRKKR